MAEEEHAKKNNSTNTAFYVAVIALVVAIAAIGYAATQGGQFSSFDKRITQNEEKQNAVDAKIAAQQTALAAFQKQLDTRLADLTVALSVYYDSDCAFCDNAELLLFLDGIEPQLKNQGITLERIDVSGKNEETVKTGIDRVPAFYASRIDLLKEPAGKYLQNVMSEWELTGSLDAYNAQEGIVLTPKNPSEMLTEPCLSNATTLQYFYSETCKYCKRVKTANGTVMNPDTNIDYKAVISDSLEQIKTEFGETLSVTQHCLGLHTALENYQTLGINKSDAQLCVETQGEDKSIADEMLAGQYRFSQPPTVPVFVVNCKYLFKVNATTPDAITAQLCAIKPSLAACKKS